MAKYVLPFYSEFFKVLENNEILNWRANDFVLAVLQTKCIIDGKNRQLIYKGLNVLVQCNFLQRERDQKNKKLFRYSETIRLKVHKENVLHKKIKDALIIERGSLEASLAKNRVEQYVIKDIVHKNPEFGKFFEKYDVSISNSLIELESKAIFIKHVINDIEAGFL